MGGGGRESEREKEYQKRISAGGYWCSRIRRWSGKKGGRDFDSRKL
jgi:hypothetical protein